MTRSSHPGVGEINEASTWISRRFDSDMRVLHVVENLNNGSVETWLARMLAYARKRGVDVDWTFYCTVGRSGAK